MNACNQKSAKLLAAVLATAVAVCALAAASEVEAADGDGPVVATDADGNEYFFDTVAEALKDPVVFVSVGLTADVAETEAVAPQWALDIDLGGNIWTVSGLTISADCTISNGTIACGADAELAIAMSVDGGILELDGVDIAVTGATGDDGISLTEWALIAFVVILLIVVIVLAYMLYAKRNGGNRGRTT